MFRSAPLRALLSPASPASRGGLLRATPRARVHLIAWESSRARALQGRASQPLALPVTKFSTSARLLAVSVRPSPKEIEKEAGKLRHQKLPADPANVTTASSVRALAGGGSADRRKENVTEEDTDMLRNLRADMKTFKETFDMSTVPKEMLRFGGLGLTPYVATSFTTLYLAWDINYARDNGIGYLVSGETAEALLNFLEPIQVGLGAVILSFLGAIHWGLEMAQYGGQHPLRRYTIGILAPILAWPTVLLPLDYALIVQFVGLTGMYFADAQATAWGWAPHWYTTYRFMLTFIVGACIVITLIGRGRIGDDITRNTQGSATAHLKAIRESQWGNIQKEEEDRVKHLHEEQKAEKEASEKEQREGNSKSEESSNKDAADPGKRAKGDQPGTQGTYSDDKQGGGDKKPNNPGMGEPTEPTGEKKHVKPAPDDKAVKNTGMRG